MVSIGKRERMLIIKGEKMSKNDKKRIDVIKSVFANVRKKKLQKEVYIKNLTRQVTWLDTHETAFTR
jgi:hypothetical protein